MQVETALEKPRYHEGNNPKNNLKAVSKLFLGLGSGHIAAAGILWSFQK